MIWVKLTFAVAGAYLVLALAMYLLQPRLLYFPQPLDPAASPLARGLQFEDVWLTTADGVRIHGWYIPAAGADRVVLFLHGNAGSIGDRLDTVELIHGLGLAQLIIDYRGYGRSGGRPSEQGTYADALAAWTHLTETRQWLPAQLLIWGRSLGGAVATGLAAQRPSLALIVESSFTSLPDLGAAIYPWLPVRLLARFDYDSRRRIAGVARPILIVHSRDDEIIPFAHAQALYDAALEPRTLLAIRGPHNGAFLLDRGHYLHGVEDFLGRL